jgi:hypothetical protein
VGAGLDRLFLAAVTTDAEARLEEGVWLTRCLHCRTRLAVSAGGEPLGSTSLEHVVPRAWFRKRQAAALVEGLSGPSDPRNLAVACTRCNHAKGYGPDARGPSDARAREVIAALQRRRLERYRG